MRTVSKSATFLATESVNSAPIKKGETEVQIFWQGKAQNSSPILRCTFLARRSAKLIANFCATMVTSLPSFSLRISLSLSPNVPHAQYIGNASAFPIIGNASASAFPIIMSLQTTLCHIYGKLLRDEVQEKAIRGYSLKSSTHMIKRHFDMRLVFHRPNKPVYKPAVCIQ